MNGILTEVKGSNLNVAISGELSFLIKVETNVVYNDACVWHVGLYTGKHVFSFAEVVTGNCCQDNQTAMEKIFT